MHKTFKGFTIMNHRGLIEAHNMHIRPLEYGMVIFSAHELCNGRVFERVQNNLTRKIFDLVTM